MQNGRVYPSGRDLKICLCGALVLLALLSPGWAAEAQGGAGAVEGRVFDRDSGEPLAGVEVLATTAAFPGAGVPGQEGTVTTGADGRYRIEGLEPGSYRAFVLSPGNGYIGQIYSDFECAFANASSGGGCAAVFEFAGDRFGVAAGQTAGDIDFPLDLGGEISGRVTDARTGEPVRLPVILTDRFGDLFTELDRSRPDASGAYRLRALPAGAYRLIVPEIAGYAGVTVDGVEASLGAVTTVDIALERLPAISGTITEEGSGDPVGGGAVEIYDESGTRVAMAETDFEGTYLSEPLPDGTYFLRTKVGFDRPWIDQRFGGGTCVDYRPCDVTEGTPVVLSGGLVTEIDFVLPLGGRISGTTLRGGEPHLTPVVVYGEDGTFVGTGFSDELDGSYEIQGLLGGTYFLLGLGTSEAPQLYENLPCGPDNTRPTCDVTTGTPVPVALEETTMGIDFNFPVSTPGQCAATDARLCLNNGRFEVEMVWETPDFAAGNAAAVDLAFADDSGYFWFFDPNNVEVVVKVLDACQTRFNSFWVFAAGLTNLHVEMTVRDTVTGEVQTYTNPPQTPYEPILDTQAFRTCEAEAPGAVGAAAGVPLGAAPLPTFGNTSASGADREPVLSVPDARALRLLRSLPGPSGTDCTPSTSAICLQGGRFRVEADWETPDGSSGNSLAEALTDDTGVLSFFDPNNLEIVVKVLSNCQGASNRFWVFAGGLTNLEVTLRVTDTQTGDVKTYVNPQGEPFDPIQDTRAFDTCGE